MNQAQALSLLWERVRLKVGARHSHNLMCGTDAAQCLSCGGKALIYETLLSHNRFCDEECQKGLRGLDSFLSLGMKRGAAAIEEVQPDFETVELPDDVLGFLLAFAYGFRLMSTYEYWELLSFRIISKQFRYVIDETAIPAIRFLCGEILSTIDPRNLIEFTGLETLAHGILFRARGSVEAAEMPPELLIRFRHLRVLILRHVQLPLDSITLSHMRSLEELRLFEVEVYDPQVMELGSLQSLTIEHCSYLTSACLDPLRKLQSLTLEGQLHFQDLNACKQLERLHLATSVKIDDAGIADLSQLSHLSLAGKQINGLRRITSQCLKNKLLLKSLDLSWNPTIANLEDLAGEPVVEALRHNLVTLDISGRGCAFSWDEVILFEGLTSLDVAGRRDLPLTPESFIIFPKLTALYMEGLDADIRAPWKMPVGLTTLSVSSYGVGTSYLKPLINLECLHLYRSEVGDAELREMPQLRVLTLSSGENVSTSTVQSLTNLRELILPGRVAHLTYDAVENLRHLTHIYWPEAIYVTREEVNELRKRGVVFFDARSVVDVDERPPHFRAK
jgi:hypothetical protein